MNADWHRDHPLPRTATIDERVAWHREHAQACACRPVPPSLLQKVAARDAGPAPAAAAVEQGFASIVAAFAGDRLVRTDGKGFGAGALKVGGRIFAMVSSRGQFVIKLPRTRVAELVRAGQGEPFDGGRGAVMKEWLVVRSPVSAWLELSREAYRFVKG